MRVGIPHTWHASRLPVKGPSRVARWPLRRREGTPLLRVRALSHPNDKHGTNRPAAPGDVDSPSTVESTAAAPTEVITSTAERRGNSDDRGEAEEEPTSRPGKGLLTRILHIVLLPFTLLRNTSLRVAQALPVRGGLGILMLATVLWAMVTAGITRGQRAVTPREVLYSDFVTLVHGKHVSHVRIAESTEKVYFTLKSKADAMYKSADSKNQQTEGRTGGRRQRQKQQQQQEEEVAAAAQRSAAGGNSVLYTRSIRDPNLIPMLISNGVAFGAVKPTLSAALSKVLGTVLLLWIPLLPLLIMFRNVVQGRSGTRKKSADEKSGTAPTVTFEDVAGVEGAKEELLEVVACLRHPERFQKMKAAMPSGVLLAGPPGTGKTLLARAVAGEAGVPFFSSSASEFVELFVGRGAARVRELFAEARKRAPCVVFIDELDAVGSRRGMGFNDERDQTLNQLLTELDGFESRPGILLLAATNRKEVLDPALLRPGRISRVVTMPTPNEAGRRDILQVHLRGRPVEGGSDEAKDLAVGVIARETPGCSGAELANVVNEAALLAVRRGADEISLADLRQGVQRTRFGVDGRASSPPQWLVQAAQKLQQLSSPPNPVKSSAGM